MLAFTAALALGLAATSAMAQGPPSSVTCPAGKILASPAPIPRVQATRSAIRPNRYEPSTVDFFGNTFDNVWNESLPFQLSGDASKRSYGLNAFLRKGDKVVVALDNLDAGQEIKVLPMIPACDGYLRRSLKLELFKKDGSSWTSVQTAVNEKGTNEREIYWPSGLWLPENYPLNCLTKPFLCPVEPTENIIKYNTVDAGEELKLEATLTGVRSGRDREGDVFLFKSYSDEALHRCQTPEEADGYNELRKALVGGKSFHDRTCDDIFPAPEVQF